MKIAVFLTWDYSLNTWKQSGTLIRELEIFKHISETKNFDFTFVTYGDKYDFEIIPKEYNFKVVPIYSLVNFSSNKIIRFLYSFTIPFKLKKILYEADVLFQHQLLGCWVPIIYKILYKKKLIIRTGYDMLDFAIKDRKSFFIKLFYRLLTRIGIKYSDIYSLSSNTDLNYHINKFSKFQKKFRLRPNWVFLQDKNDIINRKENKVLAIGRFVSQKNFDFLITELSRTNQNLVLDIVGSGNLESSLKNISENVGLKVNFLGNMSHEKIMKIYTNYKFFITTSFYEGNPKTVLEAMSSGCIVLASNIPNHQELISDKYNGFLFDLKKHKLEHVINEIDQGSYNLELISKMAVKRILDNNSLKDIGKKMIEDFNSL